jgi:hypothetical protein
LLHTLFILGLDISCFFIYNLVITKNYLHYQKLFIRKATRMLEPQLFQGFFIGILVATFVLSGTFRRRARQLGGTIARAQEGRWILGLRLLLSAPLYLSLLAYMINPT